MPAPPVYQQDEYEGMRCPRGVSCPHSAATAEEAAKAAVCQVFTILGVDVNNPESVENFREDLRFGKKLRRAADHGILAILGVIATALAAVVWAGIVAKLAGKG